MTIEHNLHAFIVVLISIIHLQFLKYDTVLKIMIKYEKNVTRLTTTTKTSIELT